jgi:hypothetical protein
MKPALVGHAFEGSVLRRAGAGSFVPTPLNGRAAQIGGDVFKAPGIDDRADVVQRDTQKAVLGGGRDPHGHDPPARGAENGGAGKAQMVEKRDRIGSLLRDGVGGGAGEVRSAAPAGVEAEEADIDQMPRQVVEVAAVPGEAGQGQERKPLAFVHIEEARAVGCSDMRHQDIPPIR